MVFMRWKAVIGEFGRGRRDYFKNSVRDYVQEVLEHIESVLVA